jgi:hypothetical protein
MYTLDLPVCIPKSLAASTSPASTQIVFTFRLRFSRNAVPIGFCSGGFSSTAGYVPGNEAHMTFVRERRSSFWLFLSKKRCSFLFEQLRKIFRLFLASLSARFRV